MPRQRQLRLVKKRRGVGSLYFVATDKQDGGGNGGIITDLLVPKDPNSGGSGGSTTPFSDPRLEGVDFYSMDCAKLQELYNDIVNYMMSARLLPEAAAYYQAKKAEMEAALAICGKSIKPPDPIKPPDSGGGGVIIDPPPPPPIKTPVEVKPDPGNGVTVNVGDTSSLNPQPGSGGGGGGGEGGGKKAAEKKPNWLLWAICIGAITLSLYKGRNSTIKMPA